MIRTRTHANRKAFSLAELMIAIVILGLGLLFIAAALPVGIDYSRRNVERAEADSAAEFALDTLEMALRTSSDFDPWARRLGAPDGTFPFGPMSTIFRPRADLAGDGNPEAQNRYEPIIKVRPLVMRNVQARNANSAGNTLGNHITDRVEEVIGSWLNYANPAWVTTLEVDSALAPFVGPGNRLANNPALPATARVYPPLTSAYRVYPQDYSPLGLSGGVSGVYEAYGPADNAEPGDTDPVGAEGVAPEDLRKLYDRRISWTAFYRRVEHDKFQYDPINGAVPAFGTAGPADTTPVPGGDTLESTSDPLVYEVIVVVTQRPSENHKFAHQDLNGGGLSMFQQPTAVQPGDIAIVGEPLLQTGDDRIMPMPWLVTFEQLPTVPEFGGVPATGMYVNGGEDRYLQAAATDRPTQTFICSTELGQVLPVGSVLIPARNDYRPTQLLNTGQADWAGFIPSAPDELPIYRVIDRPNQTTVVVQNNGFYPWLSGPPIVIGASGRTFNDTYGEFPFWVIPPSFEERLPDGTPLFDGRTSVLHVARRIVRVPEVKP